jgi:hypothetical protein
MNFDKLTNDNFILFCASHYDNYQYHSTEEFYEDLNRIKYIKKLITRYVEKGELKDRLILNHIIILYNCFGPSVACKILYLKAKEQMKYIKPFLVLINILPDKIYNVGDDSEIDTNLIPMDEFIVCKLRNEINGYSRNLP